MAKIGKIKPVEITEEMKKSYLDYAMSVIVARALPDVRDGLKPVHRRILYAMQQMGLSHSAPYTKSAKVVGETMGKYHPHGDMPIYDALVRLAQDFSMRYPLIDGQGNFGSIDGDSAAAMRYCVSGNSLIVTDSGLERIKNLKKRNPHIKVLSFNNKINKASKWFDSGIHPTKTIETHRGFTLTGTYNHPILIWTRGRGGRPFLQWKLLSDLSVGDFVVISRSSLLFPQDPSLKEYYPTIKNKRVKKYQLPKVLTKELAFILGALVAEGNVSSEQIGFCNSDQEFLLKFKNCFKTVFPDCRLHEFHRKPQGFSKKEYASLEIHSTYLVQFLKNLGLQPGRAKFKKIPEIIFLSSKASIAAFLQGYTEGDGTVYLSGAPEIAFISKSKTLLQELQILLLRFGIDSSYRYQPSKQIFKLFIRGQPNLERFRREINFLTLKKRKKLLKLSQMNKDGKVMSKTDYIPYLADYLRNSSKYRGELEWLKRHNLDRYPKLKKYWPYLKKILDEHDQSLLKNLIEKEYLFDQIIRISNSKAQRVYSLKIESPCHSFVSNGFISHNTEVRMAGITSEMLADLDKETVEFVDNFDGSLKEPVFLPARLPNLLLMGSDGIAVGMATKIPPHNLSEVVDALIFMIKKGKVILPEKTSEEEDFKIKKISLEENQKSTSPDTQSLATLALSASFESEATVEQLMRFIKGPDFPTGGSIYDKNEIAQAYITGKGKILMRAKASIEEVKRGRFQIIVSELPYQVNKASLVAKIAQLIREKKIVGVSDLRDESDRRGLRIVLDLKRTAKPNAILNNLYKFTPMQTIYPANMVALVDGTPQTLTLKQILTEYIKHRQNVIAKRSLFELKAAKNRAHILEGLKIALDNLDAVISTIKRSKTAEVARENLMKKFGLSEIQANAILEMKLRRLAALERKKIEDEYKAIGQEIIYLTDLLSHPEKILTVIKKELLALQKKYADPRRTRVYKQPLGEFREEDLVPKETCLITLTRTGYIKRLPVGTYRSQRRGGKGVLGMTTKEADEIARLLTANTHDNVLFFTNRGRVFSLPAWELPQGTRTSRGQAIINLINIEQGEEIQTILPIKKGARKGFLFMATRKGMVKKTEIAQFANIRTSGLIAIKLARGDELVWVKPTTGKNHILLVSNAAKSIHFKETDVRPMGRDTMGVRGIRLKKGDFVVSMEVFAAKPRRPADRRRKFFRDILVVMENGLGKRTDIREFPLQKRGGIGVKAAQITKKTGKIVACRMVTQKIKQVILTSKKAQVIKLPLKNIPRLGRATQGVILMRFSKKGDSVAAMTCLEK